VLLLQLLLVYYYYYYYYYYCCCVCPVPGTVSDVRIVTITSKSVLLSWSAVDCHETHGPSVGYTCELMQVSSSSSSSVSRSRR